jgi:drug/metabolite transporter (DMT)-like permease
MLDWCIKVRFKSLRSRVACGERVSVRPATERDYRALITVVLLLLTGAVAIYGMYLGWTTTEILAIMAFFGPLLTAAITYYFVGKTEKLRQASTTP